jgi:hypothetical protein
MSSHTSRTSRQPGHARIALAALCALGLGPAFAASGYDFSNAAFTASASVSNETVSSRNGYSPEDSYYYAASGNDSRTSRVHGGAALGAQWVERDAMGHTLAPRLGQAEVLNTALGVFAQSRHSAEGSRDTEYSITRAVAGWSDTWFIAPSAQHADGSYGKLRLTFALAGNLGSGLPSAFDPPNGFNAGFTARSSLCTVANQQVGCESAFQPYWAAGDRTQEVQADFFFQYGEGFNLALSLNTSEPLQASGLFWPFYGGENAEQLSLQIARVEVPRGAVLESTALIEGFASYAGHVLESDDPGLNLTGAVPEPATWLLWMAGLAALTAYARRGRARRTCA